MNLRNGSRLPGELPRSATNPTARLRRQSPPKDAPPAKPPKRVEKRSTARRGLWIVLAVILAAIAAAVLYLGADRVLQMLGAPNWDGEAQQDCSNAAFESDRESTPEVQLERVRSCAGMDGVSPEIRLSVVERLLDQAPQALVIMGRWYDPAHHAEVFSPFETPAIENAARYYHEAVAAGETQAEALLQDVCTRLDPDDLMQGNAIHLYCAEE